MSELSLPHRNQHSHQVTTLVFKKAIKKLHKEIVVKNLILKKIESDRQVCGARGKT